MFLLTTDNHQAIVDAIERFYNFCLRATGTLLTEDDLKCHLFREFHNLMPFSGTTPTIEPYISATTVHSEVSWFDANGNLTVKPDITILDPQHLSLLYKIGSVNAPPSKQFHFDGSAFIFELKFVRGPQGIRENELALIREDFEKIERLFTKLTADGDAHNVFCYFVVFSRYGTACEAWTEFYNSHKSSEYWHLIYKSLNVPIPQYA